MIFRQEEKNSSPEVRTKKIFLTNAEEPEANVKVKVEVTIRSS